MDYEDDAMEVAEIMTNLKDALPKTCFSKQVPTSKVIMLSTSLEETKLTTASDKASQMKVALESRQTQCKTDKILKKFEALGTKDAAIDLSTDEVPIKSSPSWIIQEAKKTVKKEPSYPKVKRKFPQESSVDMVQYMKQLQQMNKTMLSCKHCKKTLVSKDAKHIGANETKYYRSAGVSGNVMHYCQDFEKMVARSIKKPYRYCNRGCQGSCLAVTFQNSSLFTKKPFGLSMSDIIKTEPHFGASSSAKTTLKKKKKTKMSCYYAHPYGYYVTVQNGDKIEHMPLFTTVSIPYKSERKRATKRKKKSKNDE